jgi:hypothetical protein
MVARWELVLRLRERRNQLDVDIKNITRELGFSRNYWSAIENEHKIISAGNLGKLAVLLEFNQQETAYLLELRDIAKERGWWTEYSALLDGKLQRLFGLEQGADGIRGYESLLIPGLLQTGDYAHALMDPAVTIPQVEVDQRVEIRVRRQGRLNDARPLHLNILISEAVLRQQVGGLPVLRGQLDHLLAMIDRHPRTLAIRVIPFTARAHNLLGAGTIHILDFRNPRLPTLVWHETVSTWGFIDDPDQVRDIKTSFSQATQRAIDRAESREMIERSREELD